MIPNCKKIYLCNPSLEKICQLNGAQVGSVNYSEHLRDYSELSFTVDEYIVIDGEKVKSNGYDDLDVYMYLYLEDIAYFQMQTPRVTNDGYHESKEITAYSIDKEWEDKDFVDFQCNTGAKDSLEQLAENNLDENGYAINFVKFYDPDRKDLSLIHLVLEKMPGWSVEDSDIDVALWSKKLSFSEDSINMYALMTTIIAPKADCVFIFDCLNKRIKAYYKENIDFDTNIFIGFRNLAQQINISTQEDSVYTRFNVAGVDNSSSTSDGNLTVNNWNYDDKRIFNLDYFLRSPYMTEEQIEKFTAWIQYQDDNRENFGALSQQLADCRAKINEIETRLPGDELDTDQWEEMNAEGLTESLDYYNGLVTALQASVDPSPKYLGSNGKTYTMNSDGDYVDSDGESLPSSITVTYVPTYKMNGDNIVYSTDLSDGNTEEDKLYYDLYKYDYHIGKEEDDDDYTYVYDEDLYETITPVVDHYYYMDRLEKKTNGYGGYYTYLEYIKFVIPNIKTAIYNLSVSTEDDEVDLNKDWETNWDLYGTEELNNLIESYTEKKKVLYDKNYDATTASWLDEEKHTLYDKYTTYIEEINVKIAELEDELEPLNAELETYKNQRIQLVRDVSLMETELDDDGNVVELDTPNSKWDFTLKDVILINTLFHDTDYTNNNIIATSLNYTSDVLTGSGIKTVIDVQKELYDDAVEKLSEVSQPQYTFEVTMDNIMYIKEFEPLIDDCSLLRFIRLGTRDDYSVKLRIVGRSWNPCDVTDDFSLEFSNMITSKSGRTDLTDVLNKDGTGSTSKNSISIGTGNSDSDIAYATALISTMVNNGLFSKAVSNSLNSSSAQSILSEFIETQTLQANTINVNNITGDTASFNKFFSNYIDAELIATKILRTDEIEVDGVKIEKGKLTYTDEDGNVTNYIDLLNGKMSIGNLLLQDDTITSNTGVINLFNTMITPGGVTTALINATEGNIDTLMSDTVFSEKITTLSQTSAQAYIDELDVSDLIAGKITVADLASSTSQSELITLISSSTGDPTIAFKDSTQQFYDSNGNVRVQIGQDADGDFNFLVVGEDGTTAIFDENGITTNAIADELIVNDMIKSGTVSKEKLSFDIETKTDEDGNEYVVTSINNIYTGDGDKFGDVYTSFKTNVQKQFNIMNNETTGTRNYIKNSDYLENDSYTLSDYQDIVAENPEEEDSNITIDENTVYLGENGYLFIATD